MNPSTETEPSPDLERFFLTRFERVYLSFRRRGFTHDQAMDLTQETYVRVFNSRAHFDSIRSPAAWLYRIAYNVMVSHFRRKKEHLRDLTETAAPWEDRELDPELQALSDENAEKVRECIQAMAPMMKKCLILRYYHGLKYEEIVDFLGISINTVKTHLSRALRQLRNSLHTPDPPPA